MENRPNASTAGCSHQLIQITRTWCQPDRRSSKTRLHALTPSLIMTDGGSIDNFATCNINPGRCRTELCSSFVGNGHDFNFLKVSKYRSCHGRPKSRCSMAGKPTSCLKPHGEKGEREAMDSDCIGRPMDTSIISTMTRNYSVSFTHIISPDSRDKGFGQLVWQNIQLWVKKKTRWDTLQPLTLDTRQTTFCGFWRNTDTRGAI